MKDIEFLCRCRWNVHHIFQKAAVYTFSAQACCTPIFDQTALHSASILSVLVVALDLLLAAHAEVPSVPAVLILFHSFHPEG